MPSQTSGMSCSNCVFSMTSGDNQTGCSAGRLDKFVTLGAFKPTGSNYYQIPRFCNMYRNKEPWASGLSNLNEMLKKASYEAAPLFGIAVRDCPSRPFSDLERTVKSILDLDYDKDKVKTVISSFHGRGLSAVSHLVNVLQDGGNKHSSCIFHINHRPDLKDTEIFKKLVQSHYFVNVEVGTRLKPDLFRLVDHSLNTLMERVCMFEDEGVTIIRKHLMTKFYLQFKDYNKAVDHVRNLCMGPPQTNGNYLCLQGRQVAL